MSKNVVVLGFGLVLLVVLSNAIDCPQVSRDLGPCVGWLQSGGGAPPADCCNGVRSLAGAAGTTEDRRQACNCIKSAANGMPNINDANVGSLPDACGVRLSFRPSINTNCATVP